MTDASLPAREPGLRLRGVTVLREGRKLFAEIDLDLGPGEIVGLLGPSGIGKSSLLAYLCGALPPGLEGRGGIWLDGHDLCALPTERRRIGLLFQDGLLFPHMTIAQNLGFGLSHGLGRQARAERIEAALKAADLQGFGGRMPQTLSGGQQRRAALLRALLAAPRALLLDEPFSGLDSALRETIKSFIFNRIDDMSLPTILVTHDRADLPASRARCFDLADPNRTHKHV